MKHSIHFLTAAFALLAALCGSAFAEDSRRFFISSPYLSFVNGVDGEQGNIDMHELHVGYRLTDVDSIALKAASWKLYQPMGIPYGPEVVDGSQRYKGRVRESGFGLAYQRMIWKGLFAQVEIMPMCKLFLDENGAEIEDGFRLYTSYHAGWRFELWKGRVYLEPQIHCNYWPINSKGPAGFAEMEEKWVDYFLFEPNLYIGINF